MQPVQKKKESLLFEGHHVRQRKRDKQIPAAEMKRKEVTVVVTQVVREAVVCVPLLVHCRIVMY